MLKAWEAMRLGKDAQIAALMERAKRHEEDAAEKARTVDALRRKLAMAGRPSSSGSMGSGYGVGPAQQSGLSGSMGPGSLGAGGLGPGSMAAGGMAAGNIGAAGGYGGTGAAGGVGSRQVWSPAPSTASSAYGAQ